MKKHSIHLEKQIEKLKKMILALSAIVEQNLHVSLTSLKERNAATAIKVVESDDKVDHMEVEIEEECLKTLALYQPIVAGDLRLIVSILKINNDLERIADLAVNIAERAIDISKYPSIETPDAFEQMSGKAQWMLKACLNSFVDLDSKLARQICDTDDEVDDLLRSMYLKTQQEIRDHPERLNALISVLSISRYIERVADHATNIAEDVIYLVEGEIVRHKSEIFRSPPENDLQE